jgi:hypothetical protein
MSSGKVTWSRIFLKQIFLIDVGNDGADNQIPMTIKSQRARPAENLASSAPITGAQANIEVILKRHADKRRNWVGKLFHQFFIASGRSSLKRSGRRGLCQEIGGGPKKQSENQKQSRCLRHLIEESGGQSLVFADRWVSHPASETTHRNPVCEDPVSEGVPRLALGR